MVENEVKKELTAKAYRDRAWAALCTRGWFFRIVLVSIVLGLVSGFADVILRLASQALGMDASTEAVETMQGAMSEVNGLPGLSFWMLILFSCLWSMLFNGIKAYGLASVMLETVRSEPSPGYVGRALDGFRRPFELLFLMLRFSVRLAFWTLLFIIPGVVAYYRYRYAFQVKVDHPDWSSGRCLSESARLMDGHKWRAFALDASFWGWILMLIFVFMLLMPTCLAAGYTPDASGMAAILALVFGFVLLVVSVLVGVYMATAQTAFYDDRQRKDAASTPA